MKKLALIFVLFMNGACLCSQHTPIVSLKDHSTPKKNEELKTELSLAGKQKATEAKEFQNIKQAAIPPKTKPKPTSRLAETLEKTNAVPALPDAELSALPPKITKKSTEAYDAFEPKTKRLTQHTAETEETDHD